MNKEQKIVAGIVAVVLLGMLIYPPFHLIHERGTVLNMGYSFIFVPPSWSRGITASVNVSLLFLQMAVVCIVGGIAYSIFKDKS